MACRHDDWTRSDDMADVAAVTAAVEIRVMVKKKMQAAIEEWE